MMIGLLTWPAYGSWFASRRRGWIDRDQHAVGGAVPEPVPHRHTDHRDRPWPPVLLDAAQRHLVIRDLGRLAALRGFELYMAVAAADHVHVLLAPQPDGAVERLVQLIKGSLSRTLTLATGDLTATSDDGTVLPHHKWWARQYSYRSVTQGRNLLRVVERLADHDARGATVWKAAGWTGASRL